MNSTNITPIIEKIHGVVENHKLAAGSYKRFPTDTEPNPYGCADAANILYSIGAFPRDAHEREESVRILGAMQDAERGMFHETIQHPELTPCHVHHDIHTTAHCMAALELFDAAPLYPAKELEKYLAADEFEAFMETVDWRGNPWSESHKPAGLYAALNLGGSNTREFNRTYFKWMWDNADPITGLWRVGCQDAAKSQSLWAHMAGTFHYLFNHEHAHMPLRYPDKLIDSCIRMYKEGPYRRFGVAAGFIEIDWIYCLTRASQQTSHRFEEVYDCLEKFAESYVNWWSNADFAADKSINDLHSLFGGVCALAELQRALRGKLYSEVPLKLVLDRRPFI